MSLQLWEHMHVLLSSDERNWPVEPADQDITGKAHATPVLEAAVTDLSGQSSRLQLGHRRQLCHVVPLDVQS